MSYNTRNKLLQMQHVIDIYLEHKTDDVTVKEVHRRYIYPIYHISISTLYTYLNTPVKKLLKELEAEKNANQLKMFS